jgi:uncharacterized membrane protein YebE (DUF533 family)
VKALKIVVAILGVALCAFGAGAFVSLGINTGQAHKFLTFLIGMVCWLAGAAAFNWGTGNWWEKRKARRRTRRSEPVEDEATTDEDYDSDEATDSGEDDEDYNDDDYDEDGTIRF